MLLAFFIIAFFAQFYRIVAIAGTRIGHQVNPSVVFALQYHDF